MSLKTTMASYETPDLSAATVLQNELLTIWREVLGISEIGAEDDFFDLGGHSLLSLEIRQRIKKTLGVSFIRVDVLATPTVALMTEAILEQLNAAAVHAGAES